MAHAALTRNRVNDRPVTWHVHHAGVRVGLIVERSGVAKTAEPWEWHCVFYPGSNPGVSRTSPVRVRSGDYLPHPPKSK
jgi:hypothetical protein